MALLPPPGYAPGHHHCLTGIIWRGAGVIGYSGVHCFADREQQNKITHETSPAPYLLLLVQ